MSGTERPAREVDAAEDRGRRWYHLRPTPRGRADLMGINAKLWMALGWVVVIAALVFPFPWWW